MISNDYELLDSLDLLYCFKTSFKRYLIPDIGDQCLCDTSQPPDPVARPVQVRELVREPPVAAEDGDTAQDVLGLRRPAPPTAEAHCKRQRLAEHFYRNRNRD